MSRKHDNADPLSPFAISFEERSAWVQLIALGLIQGGYFLVAGRLLAQGILIMPAYVGLFIASTVLLVIVLVLGHIFAAVIGRVEQADERDRMISARAEARSSWLLGVGVLIAVCLLVIDVQRVFVAHTLLVSLFGSEMLKLVSQLVQYRRGTEP